MAHRHSDEFKMYPARIALTSGLTHRQVSADLGVGISTLTKWVKAFS
jgi:transposase